MFKRLHLGTAGDALVIAGFFVSLAVFILCLIRVFRMKRKHVEHMSRLPLDNNPKDPSS